MKEARLPEAKSHALPRRGYTTALNVKNGRLHVQAEVELVEKFARSYRIVREPLTNALLPGRLNKVRPVCGYVAIGPDGRVVKAGTASYAGDGAFAVDLTAELTSLSTILAAVYVDESSILPPVRMLRLGPQ